MPKITSKVTAKFLNSASDGMHFVENGLYLDVRGSGKKKYWRWKYKHNDKHNTASYGTYPEIGLAEAKEKHREAQQLVSRGVDYNKWKKQQKQTTVKQGSNTFEAIAREWYEHYKENWAKATAVKVIPRLEKNAFPYIGNIPIGEIKAQDIQRVINKINERQANDTAVKIKQHCSQIFKYAGAHGLVNADPTVFVLAKKKPSKHYTAFTDPENIGRILRMFDAHRGSFQVKAALQLAPMFFVRPINLRQMEWSEVNWERKQWTIPKEKTKRKKDDLIVPLARQAVAILRELHKHTGHRQWAFPGRDPSKPMSDGAVNAALRAIGIDTQNEITGHGFRAMARTVLEERLGQNGNWIERQLDHAVHNPLGAAYNRTQFLPERIKMMQLWADWLDEQKKTIPDSGE